LFHKNKAKGKTFFTAEELISKSQAQRIQEIFQESYKKQRSYEDSGIKEIEKPVFSPQKPTHRIHLRPLRKVQPYPKYISRVAEIYEKARFQKLYGQKEEPEDVLPSQCLLIQSKISVANSANFSTSGGLYPRYHSRVSQ